MLTIQGLIRGLLAQNTKAPSSSGKSSTVIYKSHVANLTLQPSIEIEKSIHTCYTWVYFPRFTRENPLSWVDQANYFSYNFTPNNEKIQSTTFHLKRKVVKWYQWMEKSIKLCSLEEFRSAIGTRFGASEYAKPGEALAKLQRRVQCRTIKRHSNV